MTKRRFRLIEGFKNIMPISKRAEYKATALMRLSDVFTKALVASGIEDGVIRIRQGDRMYEISIKSEECGPNLPAG